MKNIREKYRTVKLLYTVEEAARLLSVSVATLYRLMAKGDVRYIKIGRARRIKRDDLVAYVEQV